VQIGARNSVQSSGSRRFQPVPVQAIRQCSADPSSGSAAVTAPGPNPKSIKAP